DLGPERHIANPSFDETISHPVYGAHPTDRGHAAGGGLPAGGHALVRGGGARGARGGDAGARAHPLRGKIEPRPGAAASVDPVFGFFADVHGGRAGRLLRRAERRVSGGDGAVPRGARREGGAAPVSAHGHPAYRGRTDLVSAGWIRG